MIYQVEHTTWYSYTQPVPFGHNLVRVAPRDTSRQTCHEHHLEVQPEASAMTRRTDYFGNLVDYFSVRGAHLGLRVTAKGWVEVTPPSNVDADASEAWEEVARTIRTDRSAEGLRVSQFIYPSAKVNTFGLLREYAAPSFPARRPLVAAICDLNSRIHADFVFDHRATTINTPLEELLRNRRGVCQDFAHLAIGCLRSLGLAARYVSGYICTSPPPGQPRLVGADASHAWLSVYCGELGWIDIDPTNDVLVGDSHITIGWGRDYDDICPIQGVFVGGGEHTMGVRVDVTPEHELADRTL